MKRNDFAQVMGEPTHMQGGIIDHLYIRQPEAYNDVEITYDLFAPFYSDHFGINVTLFKRERVFNHIESSVPDDLIRQEEERDRKENSKRRKLDQKNNQSKRKQSKSPEKPKRHRQ